MARIDTLLKSTPTLGVQGPRDHEVTGVVCDSRFVKPGYLFVAIPGNKEDGRLFIEDAVQRGAVAVVAESTNRSGRSGRDSVIYRMDICYVYVADARQAVADLATAFHERPSERLRVAGITGTNGKTTTAYMIRSIWKAANLNPGLISTVEYAVGARTIPASRTTPDAATVQAMLAQMLAADCRSAVMEVSSHALDQKRVAGIEFDVAVFTNLTRDHLDYHKTFEDYFRAKSQLFLNLGRGRKRAVGVINVDDAWGEKLRTLDGVAADRVTYGLKAPADVRAENIRLGPENSLFTARTPWGNVEVALPLLGRYNVSNALAALTACMATGSRLVEVADVLGHLQAVPGRLEKTRIRRGVDVFVDYAHTDDALERVLETLRELTTRRVLVVFGCGGKRDRSKRPAMGRVAARLADMSIITSDNPRTEDPLAIIEEIRAGFGDESRYEVIEDRARAIERALEIAEPGDLVLVAGKGHETFQEFANRTVPFDDRQIVRRYV